MARTILAESELTPLVQSENYAEVCRRAKQVLGKTNLVFPNEMMAFSDGLKSGDGERQFAVGLYRSLYGDEEPATQFTQFAEVLERMGAAKWTLATYWLFLRHPEEFMFVKPKVTQDAAALCRFDILYSPQLSWGTYQRILAFSKHLMTELENAGLKPRDFIDVQSFIWCLGKG